MKISAHSTSTSPSFVRGCVKTTKTAMYTFAFSAGFAPRSPSLRILCFLCVIAITYGFHFELAAKDAKDKKTEEYLEACKEGDIKAVRALIKTKQINLKAYDKKRNDTALHLAASSGSIELVAYLLNRGLNIQARNKLGDSVLFNAAYSGNIKLLEYLMKKGLSPFDSNNKGYTLMHYAAYSGELDLIKHLIKLGLNPRAKSKEGFNPIQAAVFGGNFRVASFLKGTS